MVRAVMVVVMALCLGSLACATVHAQAADKKSPVTWTVAMPNNAEQVTVGSTVVVEVSAKIDDGWHIYAPGQPPGGAIPTHITVQGGSSFNATDSLRAEPPLERYDSTFGMKILTYEGGVTFGVPVKVLAAKVQQDTLKVAVRYEVCNAEQCMPPRTEVLKLPLTIVSARRR